MLPISRVIQTIDSELSRPDKSAPAKALAGSHGLCYSFEKIIYPKKRVFRAEQLVLFYHEGIPVFVL